MALLSATACHKNPFGIEYYRRKDDYGSVPTDKQKCRPKEQHEFISMARKLWQHQEKMRLKSTDIKKSNIMEKNYTDKLEKKIDFLTDILTEEQLDQYIKWCEENGI